MANEMDVKISGFVYGDPEFKYTPSGLAAVDFIVVSTPTYFNQEKLEMVRGEDSFMECVAWRKLAENIADDFSDEAPVLVFGTLRSRRYVEEDGSEGVKYYVDVHDAGLSLR